MKQVHKPKRRRGPAGRRREPPAASLRDPDIVHAHQIARRDSRPGARGVRSGRRRPAPVPGR